MVYLWQELAGIYKDIRFLLQDTRLGLFCVLLPSAVAKTQRSEESKQKGKRAFIELKNS